MTTYGLTEKGVNIKRLDTIVDEIHDDLTSRWGVNTRNNPESFLGHLIVNISEKLAELWEFGQQVYNSQYPSSAEGISLDNVAQYGGSVRKEAAASRYPIHCKGIDGTVLETGTLIKSNTNPAVELATRSAKTITRTSCNEIAVKVSAVEDNSKYYIEINKEVFEIATGNSATEISILTALKDAMEGNSQGLPGIINFTMTLDEDNALLIIQANDLSTSNIVVLSENLTTEYVVSLATFYTAEVGDITLPNGTITEIVQAVSGLLEVNNRIGYIAGREIESDTDFRISYIDEIFNRSSAMLESIKAAILDNVQGVSSVSCYENPSHEWDAYGRPPHSVEIIVDGGDSSEIAQQILDNKAGGIATYAAENGRVSVVLPGKYDEDITVYFGRPEKVYVYYQVYITVPDETLFPQNGNELLSEIILEYMDGLDPGDDVIPVKFISALYEGCSGVSDIEISLFATTDKSEIPSEYPNRTVPIECRQLAQTTANMIQIRRKTD